MDLEKLKKLYPEFDVLDVTKEQNELVFLLKSKNDFAFCQYCGGKSISVHQRYDKILQDLPIDNKNVTLIIKARVYRCDNSKCDHFSFNEQFELFDPIDQKTKRLIERIVNLSRNATCREVAKVLNEQGVIISKATVNNIYNKYK